MFPQGWLISTANKNTLFYKMCNIPWVLTQISLTCETVISTQIFHQFIGKVRQFTYLLTCYHLQDPYTKVSIKFCIHKVKKGNGSPYSITKRRVPELILVLGNQPAGDVSHKPGGWLPLLSVRPAVTPTTLKRAATNFAAWWTEAQWA